MKSEVGRKGYAVDRWRKEGRAFECLVDSIWTAVVSSHCSFKEETPLSSRCSVHFSRENILTERFSSIWAKRKSRLKIQVSSLNFL